MPVYSVIEKATGTEIYRYRADSVIEWSGMQLSDYNHVECDDIQTITDDATYQSRRLTKLDYLKRFSDSELANIYAAAKVNVNLEVWLDKFRLAEFIDTSDVQNIEGLGVLESVGLIGPGRAMEILNGN